jgi:hypothetical protein
VCPVEAVATARNDDAVADLGFWVFKGLQHGNAVHAHVKR